VSVLAQFVLDASALLAYLQDESGTEQVAEAMESGTVMSAANWAEVLSKLADEGEDPYTVASQLAVRGLIGGAIEVVSLTEADAIEIARLRPLTRTSGLSLGDRACLALGTRLRIPILTADRLWASLKIELEIKVIRGNGAA
jgi:PIN domain nuclease of toxin-antitoxin system